MNDHEHELTTAAQALDVLARSETFPRELRTTLRKARGKVAHMLAVIRGEIGQDKPVGDGAGVRDITDEVLEAIGKKDSSRSA